MRYIDYVKRGRGKWGDKFSESSLSRQFIEFYNSGERIKVRMSWGEILTGTVGVTTGWVPSFMLMKTRRSMGSSDLLSDRDTPIAVKRGRVYVDRVA